MARYNHTSPRFSYDHTRTVDGGAQGCRAVLPLPFVRSFAFARRLRSPRSSRRGRRIRESIERGETTTSPRLASPRARDDDTDHTHLVDDSRAHRIDNQSTRITRARCVTHHPSSRSIDRPIDRSIRSIDPSIEAFASIDRSIDPSIERPRPVAVSIEPRGRRVVASLFFFEIHQS